MAASYSASIPGAAAPSLQSAASRVFAVPELLEEILLLLTRLRPAVPDHSLGTYYHYNSKALFSLQRVSKEFQNTIQGSAKLKRLMFLGPRDETGPLSWPVDHAPLIYFCRRLEHSRAHNWSWDVPIMLVPDRDLGVPYEDGVFIVPLDLRDDRSQGGSLVQDLESAFRQGWERAEASWRRIKISNSAKPKPVRISVSALVETSKSATATWLLSGDTTFGRVYELIHGFLEIVDQRRMQWQKLETAFEAHTVALMNARLGTGDVAYQ